MNGRPLRETEKRAVTWSSTNYFPLRNAVFGGILSILGIDYIFPIITDGMSAWQIKKQVQQFTKNMNKYTKRIALNLGIDKNVATYVARYSYATVLKRSGASVEAISENLGHKNISTTKSYLDSFEAESRRKNAEALVAF